MPSFFNTEDRLKVVPDVEAKLDRTAMLLKGCTMHQPPIPPRDAVPNVTAVGSGAEPEDILQRKNNKTSSFVEAAQERKMVP